VDGDRPERAYVGRGLVPRSRVAVLRPDSGPRAPGRPVHLRFAGLPRTRGAGGARPAARARRGRAPGDPGARPAGQGARLGRRRPASRRVRVARGSRGRDRRPAPVGSAWRRDRNRGREVRPAATALHTRRATKDRGCISPGARRLLARPASGHPPGGHARRTWGQGPQRPLHRRPPLRHGSVCGALRPGDGCRGRGPRGAARAPGAEARDPGAAFA
jgi:hypothetical protein